MIPRPHAHTVHRSRRRTALLTLLAAGTGLLVACTGTLLPRPATPPSQFALDSAAPNEVMPSWAHDGPVLIVDLPRATAAYDSARMLYVRQPQALQAFALHAWVATPAQMLGPMLVQGLQQTGAFRVVVPAPTSVAGQWRLETALLQLQQDFTQHPSHVHLEVRAVLVDSTNRQALASHTFAIDVNAMADDPVAGAAAAQVAAHALVLAVASFCAEQVQERLPQPP